MIARTRFPLVRLQARPWLWAGCVAALSVMMVVPRIALGGPIQAVVSILPEKFFVDRIGGSHVNVSVMVGPGQSPETYEPGPRQMAFLTQARVYFRIGVPFEAAWMDRIRVANPQMLVVDVARGIERRRVGKLDADRATSANAEPDPHVWLSPPLAKRMSVRILKALIALDPAHKEEYQLNDKKLVANLDALGAEIRSRLSAVKQRTFLTFHPAWGYFADTYGLRQIAIESEGKEPGPRALLRIIEEAKRLRIKVIFVEPQYSRRNAQMIAREIGGRVVEIDPLAENYIQNMRSVAAAIANSLEGR